MSGMSILKSEKNLGEVIPNVAQLILKNASKYGNHVVFQEYKGSAYKALTWEELLENVTNIAFNLRRLGFNRQDKVLLLSPNRAEMLQLELAVMASGGVAVPIFAYFQKERIKMLIEHSDVKFIAVAGHNQLKNIPDTIANEHIIFFDDNESTNKGIIPFNHLLKLRKDTSFNLSIDDSADEICLNMYTSGTMGIPKCVQLTHRNILSQQVALNSLWNLSEKDRLLSYLPWHHSFGGIFELFLSLYNAATMTLDSGGGKDPEILIKNWEKVKPTVFFSVPRVYQMLVDLTRKDKKAEDYLFNAGLKFIFTASAPLPAKLSKEFEDRGIPVMEGWGLTETSPCCTLTDPELKRETGLVGKPIPGISVRIAKDGEIQVNGPNVMPGYYKNASANSLAFTEDHWFRTGDLGEITENGVRLIGRKDRIFKLSNGEKIIPTEIEDAIEKNCHYVSYALVAGSGKNYPVAIIFPKRNLFNSPDFDVSPLEGCFCPRNLDELGKCLKGCLKNANCDIGEKFSRVKSAMIIDTDLSIENNTLTPSLKAAPGNISNTYKAHLAKLYDDNNDTLQEDVFVIKLDED